MTKIHGRAALRSEMEVMLQQCEASSLDQAEFAASQGISLPKFKYWKRKLRADEMSKIVEAEQQNFVALEVELSGINIHYPNGVMLTLNQIDSVAKIISLIKAF